MKHYPNTVKLEKYIDSLTIWDKLKIYMEYFIIWNSPNYIRPGLWLKGYNIQTFEDFIDKNKNTVRRYNHHDNFSCIDYTGIYDFIIRFDKFKIE